MLHRKLGRDFLESRPLSLSYNTFGFADASVLLTLGQTKVHVAVSLQDSVPHFLRGKGRGWLTAEYAMMPTATKQRTQRESVAGKRQGRSIEIARLIGRSLRTVVDIDCIGEKTIVIDCDVLQADGGTRTACITAASFALEKASEKWVQEGSAERSVLQERVAALSGGIVDGTLLVDLDQDEDMRAQADFNFVMTQSGKIIEMQGTAEKEPVSWEHCVALKNALEDALQATFRL